jgi:N-acyl-D-amino-acid deacylase
MRKITYYCYLTNFDIRLCHNTGIPITRPVAMIPTSILRASSVVALVLSGFLSACTPPPSHDLILRGGTIYDGSGGEPVVGDIAIDGDTIAALGDLGNAVATTEIDVSDLAVAPGFINMMSWANESLIEDGRSQSNIRQGVTLEVMGEGSSMGPLNDVMKAEMVRLQSDIRYDIEWTTLDEYLEFLVRKGISPNVASFIGAATPREYVIGHEDREPTAEELDAMRAIVRDAMEDGALGVASSLMYPPGLFANTDELVALSEVAAEHGGMYISHMRDEGAQMIQAIEELLTIARNANIRAEIYHLKSSGQPNWHLFDKAVQMVQDARAEGLEITADVYTYPAGATGLNVTVPPWVQEGGFEASLERMRDPEIRARIIEEMNTPSDEWENMFLMSGTPDNILLVNFKNEALKPLTGKTVAEVAEMRGKRPEETIMDLIVEDGSRVGTVYFTQSEDVVRKAVSLPWVSFNSDEASLAPEGVFLKSNPHPRAYGSFARVLAKYVREEQVITLADAIRKLAALPAHNLRIERRGELREDYFADVVVFDPATIQDHATFVEPHQYATGMVHVFVNGEQVLKDGEHTGATPGRVVRGPGWVNDQSSE